MVGILQVHAIVIAGDRCVEALQNLNSEFAAELDRCHTGSTVQHVPN